VAKAAMGKEERFAMTSLRTFFTGSTGLGGILQDLGSLLCCVRIRWAPPGRSELLSRDPLCLRLRKRFGFGSRVEAFGRSLAGHQIAPKLVAHRGGERRGRPTPKVRLLSNGFVRGTGGPEFLALPGTCHSTTGPVSGFASARRRRDPGQGHGLKGRNSRLGSSRAGAGVISAGEAVENQEARSPNRGRASQFASLRQSSVSSW
jgi:hypothetical protein